MTHKMIAGVCWFQPEQWSRLKEIADDADNLDDTYEEWRQNAGRVIRQLRKQGLTVKKVPVDLEDLLLWCREQGRPLNGEARSHYASMRVSQMG